VLIILALGVYPNFLLHRINAFAPASNARAEISVLK
jgi:hypothetical protein